MRFVEHDSHTYRRETRQVCFRFRIFPNLSQHNAHELESFPPGAPELERDSLFAFSWTTMLVVARTDLPEAKNALADRSRSSPPNRSSTSMLESIFKALRSTEGREEELARRSSSSSSSSRNWDRDDSLLIRRTGGASTLIRAPFLTRSSAASAMHSSIPAMTMLLTEPASSPSASDFVSSAAAARTWSGVRPNMSFTSEDEPPENGTPSSLSLGSTP
mmetsp:Transcript_21526/g.63057  ORF Transcript_21526/g.63057 Transcript_21526/m.63057 type:complete len:218 (-) Transcript_21526:3284-3937(-)